MKEYRFATHVTMKEYNSDKWWIDSTIINNGKEIIVSAKTLKQAIRIFAEVCSTKYGIEISKNALRNKSAMYRNNLQIGYVITGSTLFDKGRGQGYTEQYVDLWTEITLIQQINFEKEWQRNIPLCRAKKPKIIAKRRNKMSRIRMITRTVTVTEVEVMCLTVSTAKVSTMVYALSGEYDTTDLALKAIKSEYETDDFKPTAIVKMSSKEVLYGMPESKFIELAEVLPPRLKE